MITKYQTTISTGNQNSYKFALGFAILNCYQGSPRLPFDSLSEAIAKLYYRNHIVFKLRETNNASQQPNAIQIINRYLQECRIATQPPRQLSASGLRVLANMLVEPPSGWGRSFFWYVLPCWQGASRNERGYYVHPRQGANEFFSYCVPESGIELSAPFVACINEHKDTLLNLTILEWAHFLEKFNLSPNLISKLNGQKPWRKLNKFRRLFSALPELDSKTCFLCRTTLSSDLTLEHVIPFDFVYTDELWNLVPAHRECNSKKGSRVGSATLLQRLNARNEAIYEAAAKGQKSLRPWTFDQFRSPEEMHERIQQLARDSIAAGYHVDVVFT